MNIIPIIAKADSLTKEELQLAKEMVSAISIVITLSNILLY